MPFGTRWRVRYSIKGESVRGTKLRVEASAGARHVSTLIDPFPTAVTPLLLVPLSASSEEEEEKQQR